MADHLPDLFRSAGLVEVKSQAQDEVVELGGPDFAERAVLWSEEIENVLGNSQRPDSVPGTSWRKHANPTIRAPKRHW
jgi:hypothetical protein